MSNQQRPRQSGAAADVSGYSFENYINLARDLHRASHQQKLNSWNKRDFWDENLMYYLLHDATTTRHAFARWSPQLKEAVAGKLNYLRSRLVCNTRQQPARRLSGLPRRRGRDGDDQ